MKKSLLILLFALGMGYWGWGQTTINFDDAAKWTAGSAGLTSYAVDHVFTDGLFSSTGGPALRNTTTAQDGFPGAFGTYSWRLSNTNTVDWRITISSGGVSTFSMKIRRWDNSPSPNYNLEYSVDGGTGWTFVALIDNTSLGNSSDWTTFNGTINNAATGILIRLKANGSTERIMVDDFIWTGYSSGGNIPPSISNIAHTPSSGITSFTTVSIAADVTDSDGTVSAVELHWGTTSGALSNTIAMSNGGSGDTYTTVSDIPAQTNGTTVYYEVKATDDDADFTTSPEQSYSVVDPATTTLPYSETFDADLGDCYTYSVSGASKYWIWNSSGYAYMSGYNSGETEEDWLVLPGINLNNYSNEFMTFDTWYQYGSDDANNYLKLFYSTDYAGIGNPTSATWTELPYTQPSASLVWESSGYVDLTGINGSMVYIAFKYNYEVTKYRNWGVDNISIMEYNLINWANLQWPGSGNITVGTTFTVYAQAWEPGVTDLPGQGAGLVAWIGYSTTDTDPSTWTDWVLAPYLGEVGNNDEYSLDLGLEILTTGTYYYASRFQLGTAPFQYGGFSGGFWDGVNNVSGVLTINPPSAQIDWANLQWPPNGTITLGGDFVVYAQVYEPGVTDLTGQGADITAWIGYSTSNTDPSAWSDWVPATYNVDAGGNDEYMVNIGAAISSTGTVYYASRFKLGLADYVYGGYVGGFWDGVNNVSGELTVNAPVIVINEVDSDTPGTDVAEFIELYDGGIGNTSLNGLVIVLFNGGVANDASYLSIDLDTYSTDANGYFVIGSTGMGTPIEIDPGSSGWLQNGADAVALYVGNAADFPNGTALTTNNLLDALVYDTSDPDDPGLLALLNPDEPQINEGGRGNSAIHSCQRIPNGSGGQRNTSTYDVALPTPGAMNYPVYTNWTGLISNGWDEAGNWDYGVPTSVKEVTIPDVAKASFPVISGSAACTNLTMNAGSSLIIGPTGSLTVTGTFINNGNLTIKSDATGTGSLIENSGVAATVERYLTEDAWHYVSAPVDDPTANVFLGMYMMEWDEPSGLWSYIVDPAYVLSTDMEGFAIWTNDNATSVFTGQLNTGSKSIGATNTFAAAHNNKGFNFAGNPYASSLDWDINDGSGWTRTAGNIDLSVYIWNQPLLQYGVYTKGVGGTNGVNNIIPPHQGFFIRCSAATGSLGVDNGARIHSSQDILKSEASDNLFKIKVSGNSYSDEIILRIDPLALLNMDQMDALKFHGSPEAPQLYSLTIDGTELSINSFPESGNYQLIPVGLEVGAEGVYTITASNFEGFGQTGNVYLEDLKEGTFTKIDENTSYEFTASPMDEKMRFLLHLNSELDVPENVSGVNTLNVYSYDKDVYITSEVSMHGLVKVYDLLGREILSEKLDGNTMLKINVNGHSGYMIVNVLTDEGTLNRKVFIR